MIEIKVMSIGCRSNEGDARIYKHNGYVPQKLMNSKTMPVRTVHKQNSHMVKPISTHTVSERDFEGVQACVCSILFKKSWDEYHRQRYYIKYDMMMRFLLMDVTNVEKCLYVDSKYSKELGDQFDLCFDVIHSELPTALAPEFGKICGAFRSCADWNNGRSDRPQMCIFINKK